MKLLTIIVFLLTVTSAFSREVRFRDYETTEEIPGIDHLWSDISKYYGKYIPGTIYFKFQDESVSGYEYPANIFLGGY